MNKIYLFCISIILHNSISNAQTTTLTQITNYNIGDKVEEPSGLAFDGTYLYTISDNSNYIFKYDTNGIWQESYDIGVSDLEGITAFGTNTLLVAIESSNTLVSYNYNTEAIISHVMDYNNQDESGESGIEGVTYDAANNLIYFLNEKDPGALIVANSNTFGVSFETELKFAEDYSGIFYVSETNELWITSDKEAKIYRCTLEGVVLETITPGIDVDNKLEGIAIDYTNKLLYVVTDAGQELIKYSFSIEKPIDPEPEEGIITIESATAVGTNMGNEPEKAINGLTGVTNDRWAAQSNDGSSYITLNLGCSHDLDAVSLYFYNSNSRSYSFKVGVSNAENGPYTEVLGLTTSTQQEAGFQNFNIEGVSGQFIRFYGYGNSTNAWNSYEEIVIYGNEECITLTTEDDLIKKDDFNAYLNSGVLTIFSEDTTINTVTIYNVSGQVITNHSYSSTQKITCDFSTNSPGVYILVINNTAVKKIVF